MKNVQNEGRWNSPITNATISSKLCIYSKNRATAYLRNQMCICIVENVNVFIKNAVTKYFKSWRFCKFFSLPKPITRKCFAQIHTMEHDVYRIRGFPFLRLSSRMEIHIGCRRGRGDRAISLLKPVWRKFSLQTLRFDSGEGVVFQRKRWKLGESGDAVKRDWNLEREWRRYLVRECTSSLRPLGFWGSCYGQGFISVLFLITGNLNLSRKSLL